MELENFTLEVRSDTDFMEVITKMREIQEQQGLPDDTHVIVEKGIFVWSVPTETLGKIDGKYR